MPAVGSRKPSAPVPAHPEVSGGYRYRSWDLAFALGFVGVWVILLSQLIQALETHQIDWLWLVPLGLLAFVVQDILSGLVHFLADTYGDEDTPFWGTKFVRPFRQHHRDPEAISRHDFLEAHGDSFMFALAVTAPTALWLPADASPFAAFFGLFILLLSLAVPLTTVAHGWAHARKPSRLGRLLQRLGLVIDPEHHDRHHAAPHQTNYCILTGWANLPLDTLGFFRGVVWLLGRFGIQPAGARPPRGLGSHRS